jgi:hypothetical protein
MERQQGTLQCHISGHPSIKKVMHKVAVMLSNSLFLWAQGSDNQDPASSA